MACFQQRAEFQPAGHGFRSVARAAPAGGRRFGLRELAPRAGRALRSGFTHDARGMSWPSGPQHSTESVAPMPFSLGGFFHPWWPGLVHLISSRASLPARLPPQTGVRAVPPDWSTQNRLATSPPRAPADAIAKYIEHAIPGPSRAPSPEWLAVQRLLPRILIVGTPPARSECAPVELRCDDGMAAQLKCGVDRRPRPGTFFSVVAVKNAWPSAKPRMAEPKSNRPWRDGAGWLFLRPGRCRDPVYLARMASEWPGRSRGFLRDHRLACSPTVPAHLQLGSLRMRSAFSPSRVARSALMSADRAA